MIEIVFALSGCASTPPPAPATSKAIPMRKIAINAAYDRGFVTPVLQHWEVSFTKKGYAFVSELNREYRLQIQEHAPLFERPKTIPVTSLNNGLIWFLTRDDNLVQMRGTLLDELNVLAQSPNGIKLESDRIWQDMLWMIQNTRKSFPSHMPTSGNRRPTPRPT